MYVIAPNCEIRVWNMDPSKKKKKSSMKRIAKPFDWSLIKPLSEDDSELMKQFDTEEEYMEYYYANVDVSAFGSKVGFSYQNSKKLYNLKREAIALKKRVETHLKNHVANKDSDKLLYNLERLIHYVTHYQEASRDLPFDWIKRRFLLNYKRGSKLSYPDVESDKLLLDTEPEVIYVLSDDDECETVNGSENVEMDPDFSRLDRLDLGISRRPVYLNLPIGLGMPHSPDKDEQKICLEFNKWTHEAEVLNSDFCNEERTSIEANHPIVIAVGNFAVAAFNNACEKHVKKGEHDNLHDFEIMECKYSKVFHFYHFYMIIEATEEANFGTYMAEVALDVFNGASILWKFVLTDYKPSGTKAMAASYLSCLKSICQTMNDLFEDKMERLAALQITLKDPERRRAVYEYYHLEHLHSKVWEVLDAKHDEHTRFHFPPDCNRRTYPALWSYPGDICCSGMVRRAEGTTCSGYDYYNPLLMDQDAYEPSSYLTGGKGS